MERLRLASLFFLLLHAGCHSDSGGPGGELPPGITIYPSARGTSWTYSSQSIPSNFRPLQPGATFQLDTTRATSEVMILGSSALPAVPGGGPDTIRAVEFREVKTLVPPRAGTSTGYQYYTIDSLAMLSHAYSGASAQGLPVARREPHTYRWCGLGANSLPELFRLLGVEMFQSAGDSLRREIPPVSILKFPLTKGRQWTYRPAGGPWRIDKIVAGDTTLLAAGGAQRCAVIRWVYDLDNNGAWDDNIGITDWISEDGLIRRTIFVKDVTVSGPLGPDPAGLIDVKEEYLLTSLVRPRLRNR